MTTYKKRLETVRVIMSTHNVLQSSPLLPAIYGELNRTAGTVRIAPPSCWLLAVLHTTRALDTALAEIVNHYGWPVQQPSLGAYLVTLAQAGKLHQHERVLYNDRIVKKRNTYMHQAGAMPQRQDADDLLTHMQDCLLLVLRKT